MGYLIECAWLKERGIITDIWQYELLPHSILDDCRMVMEGEAHKRKIDRALER